MQFFKERPYQKESADLTLSYLDEHKGDKNPVVVLPCGTGKTIVLCGIIDRFLTQYPLAKILVLSHNQEIIEQDYKALIYQFGSGIEIYAAGLGYKDVGKITVGQIQSVCRSPELFKGTHLVIVDEAHSVNTKEIGSYRTLLACLDHPCVVGLTATPFRMGHGYIHEGKATIFDDIIVDYSSREKFQSLIDDGYLCPLIGKKTLLAMNVDGVKKTGGDFNLKQLSAKVNREEITKAAVQETIKFGKNYSKWLIFAIDIEHAENITNELKANGVKADCVHSKMITDRDQVINRFKNGELRALVNVNVLTTGFDVNDIDLISMMRPTASPNIHVQTLGRGTRPYYAKDYDLQTKQGRLDAIEASGKEHCLVLDFGGNNKRLGPIDDIQIKKKGKKRGSGNCIKECPECDAQNHLKQKNCIVCDYKFEFKEKLKAVADDGDAISKRNKVNEDKKGFEERTIEVKKTFFYRHKKTGMPDSVRVTYLCGTISYSQWICPEHKGYALYRSIAWMKRRFKNPLPRTVGEFLSRVDEMPITVSIKVKGKEVIDSELVKQGELFEAGENKAIDEYKYDRAFDEYKKEMEDEIPF